MEKEIPQSVYYDKEYGKSVYILKENVYWPWRDTKYNPSEEAKIV